MSIPQHILDNIYANLKRAHPSIDWSKYNIDVVIAAYNATKEYDEYENEASPEFEELLKDLLEWEVKDHV